MNTRNVPMFDNFVIFGAQVVAFGAYTAIKHLYGHTPECFAVSSLDNNPISIDGIPVKVIDEVSHETLIVIAVTGLLTSEIDKLLCEKGYKNVFVLTSHEEHLLMSEYYKSIGKFPLLDKTAEHGDADFTLYEICSHVDKPINSRPALKPWEVQIQAGAGLTDVRICDITDNTGDNISSKNKKYFEATAMYWIWKNATSKWGGIEHYRRHLLITPDMLSDDIDAVLSLPYICYPDMLSQFKRYVTGEVADALCTALKAVCPSLYDVYAKILSGKYHYAFNMMAAKRDVYNKYCEWAFGIAEYIENLDIESIKNTRALSYVVELLTSIYFLANTDNLRIRHVEREIYS